MPQEIIITGPFSFPEGDAGAARVLGLGKALRAAGFSIIFGGWEVAGRGDDKHPDGFFNYQGFQYVSQNEFRLKKLTFWKRLIRYLLAGSNTIAWLKNMNLNNVAAIIAYEGGTIFLLRLMWLCYKKNIKLIFDCTEWYDSSHLVGGRFGLVSIDNAIRMRIINPLIGYGIVISSYLERYYKNKTKKVLKIPTLIDANEQKWLSRQALVSLHSDDGCLNLVYAGSPGKKDLLGNAIYGLRQLRREGCVVKLHIVGPSRTELLICVGGDEDVLNEVNDMLILHGRVIQSDVPNLIRMADFSILLRPQARYAQAGFPTKLVESLMAGVPLIANKTSDIEKYLKDRKEVIFISDHSPNAFAEGVKIAINMSIEKKISMKAKARLLAEKAFDYHGYVKDLTDFLKYDNLGKGTDV